MRLRSFEFGFVYANSMHSTSASRAAAAVTLAGNGIEQHYRSDRSLLYLIHCTRSEWVSLFFRLLMITILCCAVLCCAVLCYDRLCFVLLYHAMIYHAKPLCLPTTTLYCTVLHCIAFCCSASNCTTVFCFVLSYVQPS